MRALAAVALAALAGCKGNKGESADAGADAPYEIVFDERLGVEIEIPPVWVLNPPAPPESGVLFEARRKGSESDFVPPRFFVAAQPLDPPLDTDTFLRKSLASAKEALSPGEAKVHRTSTSRWVVDGIDVASFRIDYSVFHPTGGEPRDVSQRTAVAIRPDPQGVPHGIEVNLTWVPEGDDPLAVEVDRVLRSLHFRKKE